MRYAFISVLLGASGAFFHLLPVLGHSSLTQPSSALAYLSLAGTVVFLAFTFLIWTRSRSMIQATGIGLLIGFGYFGVSLHWLGESVVPDPGSYSVRAALTALGAWTLLYPWWAVAFGVSHLFARLFSISHKSARGAFLFSVVFSAADVLAGDIAFRIPLSPLSTALLDTLWAPILGVVGQHGGTALLTALSAFLALVVTRPSNGHILTATVGLCAACAPAVWQGINQANPQEITALSAPDIYLAQPNPESAYQLTMRNDPDPVGTIMAGVYRAIEDGAGADLIVLPENAIPLDLSASPEIIGDLANRLLPETILIVGFRRSSVSNITEDEFSVDTFNSAFAISASGSVLFEYDKAHLVPFGEYMPQAFYDLGFNVIAGPTITPGSALGIHSLPGFNPFSILICYEALLSGPVSRETDGADWFLNISSEGLFGETIGPRLLLQKVRLRSAETGIPMLRSATTGFTSVIDSRGAVLDALPQGAEGGIRTSVPSASPTAFRKIGYWPLYIGWIIAFASTSLFPHRHRYLVTRKMSV